MAAVKFLPLISLIEFTGDNKDDLPLDSYVGLDGVEMVVSNGTLTITWPPQYGQSPVIIHAGDWLDENGIIYPAASIAAGYVRLSDLGGLL